MSKRVDKIVEYVLDTFNKEYKDAVIKEARRMNSKCRFCRIPVYIDGVIDWVDYDVREDRLNSLCIHIQDMRYKNGSYPAIVTLEE